MCHALGTAGQCRQRVLPFPPQELNAAHIKIFSGTTLPVEHLSSVSASHRAMVSTRFSLPRNLVEFGDRTQMEGVRFFHSELLPRIPNLDNSSPHPTRLVSQQVERFAGGWFIGHL